MSFVHPALAPSRRLGVCSPRGVHTCTPKRAFDRGPQQTQPPPTATAGRIAGRPQLRPGPAQRALRVGRLCMGTQRSRYLSGTVSRRLPWPTLWSESAESGPRARACSLYDGMAAGRPFSRRRRHRRRVRVRVGETRSWHGASVGGDVLAWPTGNRRLRRPHVLSV